MICSVFVAIPLQIWSLWTEMNRIERVDPANDWFCCCCCVLICVTWEPPLFSPVRSIQIQLIFFAQQQNVATLFVDAIEKNREWNYWAANNICVCYIFWLWNANDRVSNWNNSYSQHNTKCISWSMKSQSQHLEIFVTTVNIVRLEIQTSERKKKKRNMVIKLKRPLRQSAFLISIHWSNSHIIAIHSNTEAGRRRTKSTRMRIYWYTRVCNRRHRRDTWYNCAHIDNRNGAQ